MLRDERTGWVAQDRFGFRFTPAYRVAGAPFGVTPATTWAELSEDTLAIRFGWWRLVTPRSNIADAERTGGFAFVKTAGPAHLSLKDRGVTFATNGDSAVCLSFLTPVTCLDPTGHLTHPNATLTLTDIDGFLDALDRGQA